MLITYRLVATRSYFGCK